ncbi:hypothetical protein DITRI_Ditri01bG0143200 [Diplodiscus trichospermus]
MEGCDGIEKRPSIFVVGCPNVGKRTLISRLASVEFEEEEGDDSQVVVNGWTINTKYYTADVSVCMAHLQDGFSVGSLPIFNSSTALLMVFGMSHLHTFDVLRDWVSHTDIGKFEILLCIGNKVDCIPDPSSNIRRKCLEWCIDHNIEFIEACASNAEFDKCLSVDGDLQGVERLYGALSAHMWPGMVLKSGDKITEPSLPEREESSEEENDYQFEYEALSAGSAEPWDDTGEEWVSASAASTVLDTGKSIDGENSTTECVQGNMTRYEKEALQPFATVSASEEKIDRVEPNAAEPNGSSTSELDDGTYYDFEDLDQLMSEIGNIRSNLRLMPDFQRREMAAKLAMKMAAMFGGGSDDEEEI